MTTGCISGKWDINNVRTSSSSCPVGVAIHQVQDRAPQQAVCFAEIVLSSKILISWWFLTNLGRNACARILDNNICLRVPPSPQTVAHMPCLRNKRFIHFFQQSTAAPGLTGSTGPWRNLLSGNVGQVVEPSKTNKTIFSSSSNLAYFVTSRALPSPRTMLVSRTFELFSHKGKLIMLGIEPTRTLL